MDWCVYKAMYMLMCAGELVVCPSLTNPRNGEITCSMKDGENPSYGDTCSLKCRIGYKVAGSNTRTCQSNGRWTGSKARCKRGE